MQNLRPKAGDAVILTGNYVGVNPGEIGCIGGAIAAEQGKDITFHPSIYRDDTHVSCGGGPGSFELPELHPTGLTTELICWRFKDGVPSAGNSTTFRVEVPLWEYRGTGEHPIWGTQAVHSLIADRKMLCDDVERFPASWSDDRVFRGDYCLTDIPNRPNHDQMGKSVAGFYRRRQVMNLLQHKVFPASGGYWYTVTVGGGSGFTAFRGPAELDQWLRAYNLTVLEKERGDLVDQCWVIPNADFAQWQPLRNERS